MNKKSAELTLMEAAMIDKLLDKITEEENKDQQITKYEKIIDITSKIDQSNG